MAVTTTKKKTWWSRLIMGLNNLMNPGHAWRDYENDPDSSSTFDNIVNSIDDVINNVASNSESIANRITQNAPTGAEQAQMDFSAEEAQKSRDFTEYMSRNKYQMETQSMESAGINPAMVYGGGNLVSTAANGAQGQPQAAGGSALNPFDIMMTMARMSRELSLLDAQRENIESQTDKNKAETGKFETEKDILKLELEWFPSAKRAEINELNSRVDLNKIYGDKAKAEESLTNAKKVLQDYENNYADQFYQLRNALEDATAKRELSREKLNDVQSAMYGIEKKYMEDYGMKMGSSEWYSIAVALLSMMNTTPDALIDTLISAGGSYRDKLYELFHGERPTLIHNPTE